MAVKRVNDQGLEELILESDGYVGVTFFQYGSIPCGHFAPELRALAEAFRDRVAFATVDVQENPAITEEHGVTAVPTTLVFKDGEELARYEGPYSREALKERITDILAREKKP